MSEKSFNKLSPEEREIFKEAAPEAGNFERGLIRQDRENYIEVLNSKGMEITWPDREAFTKATEPAYKQFEDKFGRALIEKIRATEAK
jgi:TRAP-type C4-dicarboxylate transport system, periplasmic component